jgi:ABC-type branched-subunit amino acid transport system ATPase component/branched-subunit amino acid ABC-type transport system permease component
VNSTVAATAVVDCFSGDSTCWTRQTVFDGLTLGLVYGLLAMGVVLIYRSTRVLNFAAGNMGLPGAALFVLLVINWSVPFWVAVPLCLIVGAAVGAVVELTVVRRLFHAPRVILLVATVGIAQLMLAIVASFPDVSEPSLNFPVAVGTEFDVLGLRVAGPKLTIIVVVPIIAVLLGWVMNRTTFGKAVAASASNPELSRLSAVNPKVISTIVWTIGGGLATLSMLLISGGGNVTGLENLGSLTFSKALAAAVIAGLASFPRAVIAGVAIGITESILRFNFITEPGLIDFVIFVVVLLIVFFQSRIRMQDEAVSAFTPRQSPLPDRVRSLWYVRKMGAIAMLAMLAIAIVLPLVHTFQPSQLVLYSTIVGFAICGCSVTVITGWSGQLSLAQMTFAGVGALTAAACARGIEFDIGVGDFRLLDLQLDPLPHLLSLLIGTFVAGALAGIIGLGSLRVRGLSLAVTTFVFAIAAQQYIYRREFFSDGGDSVRFDRATVLGVDLSDQRTYYFVCLGGLAIVVGFLARLRRSGIGRSTIAVRDNPETASAYTVSPTRTKLAAFTLAGSIAGFGGALLGGLVRNIQYNEALFLVSDSLTLVSLVVIGGLGSIIGPVLGALWVLGLPAFWPTNDVVPLLTSSIGLLIVLMYFPGGFAQVGHRLRDSIAAWVEGRQPSEARTERAAPPVYVRPDRGDQVAEPDTILATTGVRVTFGGLVAVQGVDVTVKRHEIVGLIGTNGAGKSTFMNAVGGFVPCSGSIELLGKEIAGISPTLRAKAGLGRTFQSARLFPELTVRETVQVALEARGKTSWHRAALGLNASVERRQAREADELIGFLGLGRYCDSYIADLSTGTRRIVEIANLLALDARLLCLDEPTAGLAQRETEAFAPLMTRVREELGAAMLIIEHDMPLIMSISDRVYCLDGGAVIAEGLPNDVKRNPDVIAAYLGTDDRAIERSDIGAEAS